MLDKSSQLIRIMMIIHVMSYAPSILSMESMNEFLEAVRSKNEKYVEVFSCGYPCYTQQFYKEAWRLIDPQNKKDLLKKNEHEDVKIIKKENISNIQKIDRYQDGCEIYNNKVIKDGNVTFIPHSLVAFIVQKTKDGMKPEDIYEHVKEQKIPIIIMIRVNTATKGIITLTKKWIEVIINANGNFF